MAPREPDEISENDLVSNLVSEEESASGASDPSNLINELSQNGEMVEEEYHTEPEDDEELHEDDDDDGGVAVTDAPPASAPLLPAELLKPLPSPAHSWQNVASTPWSQMTRTQKKAQRNRSRQAKKRTWDRLRQETEGSGVLEAGTAAQVKRGIVQPKKHRVKKGRIEKAAKPKVSGRQNLLESRKRMLVEREVGPTKKKVKKSRR